MPQLGGWHRLSVVIMVAWTATVALWMWQSWPVHIRFEPIQVTAAEAEQIKLQLYESTSVARRDVVVKALVLWLVPPLAVLVSGLAIRWVYRGFKPATRPLAHYPPEPPRIRKSFRVVYLQFARLRSSSYGEASPRERSERARLANGVRLA